MIFNVSDTVDKFKILSLGVLTIMVPSKETIQNHKDIEFYYVRLSLSFLVSLLLARFSLCRLSFFVMGISRWCPNPLSWWWSVGP
jgi:hypothetical protein